MQQHHKQYSKLCNYQQQKNSSQEVASPASRKVGLIGVRMPTIRLTERGKKFNSNYFLCSAAVYRNSKVNLNPALNKVACLYCCVRYKIKIFFEGSCRLKKYFLTKVFDIKDIFFCLWWFCCLKYLKVNNNNAHLKIPKMHTPCHFSSIQRAVKKPINKREDAHLLRQFWWKKRNCIVMLCRVVSKVQKGHPKVCCHVIKYIISSRKNLPSTQCSSITTGLESFLQQLTIIALILLSVIKRHFTHPNSVALNDINILFASAIIVESRRSWFNNDTRHSKRLQWRLHGT